MILDLTEQDLHHTQHNKSLPDTADIHDWTTLSVLETPLESIPEEPTNEPDSIALRSEEPPAFEAGGGFSSQTFIPSPDKPSYPHNRSPQETKRIRRAEKVAAKKKKCKADFKYGIEIQRNWTDIMHIDNAAGNTLWADAVKKVVAALIHHGCFHFVESKGFKLKKDEY